MGDIDFKPIIFMCVGFFVTVPFAAWKWVEIIIWVAKHIHIF